MLAATVTAAVGLLVALLQLQSVNEFSAEHYLFTYQDGLVRRALLGSLLALGTGDASVSRGLVTLLGLGYLALLIGIAWARGDWHTVALLAVLLVASLQPMALAYDTGKFDTLLLSLTAIVILGSRRTAVIVATCASFVGVLIQEIHAVAGVPLILALLLARHGTLARSRLLLPLIVGVPVAIAVVAVGLGATTVGAPLEPMAAGWWRRTTARRPRS